MNLHWKSFLFGSASALAVGTVAYYYSISRRKADEIMEIIFTHDRSEEKNTKDIHYLAISDLNFSPRNLQRIEEYINAAKMTIDAAVYLFNVKQLGSALIRAFERGVAIRIVGCKSMQGATGTQFQELRKAGIPVLFKDTTMCMHHKFCLIDTRAKTEKEKIAGEKRIADAQAAAMKQKSKQKLKERKVDKFSSEISQKQAITPKESNCQIPEHGICITGSCNWTMQGFSSNWENVMITSHIKVVQAFRREFDRIWNDFKNAQVVSIKH